jgi:hypothetical protein
MLVQQLLDVELVNEHHVVLFCPVVRRVIEELVGGGPFAETDARVPQPVFRLARENVLDTLVVQRRVVGPNSCAGCSLTPKNCRRNSTRRLSSQEALAALNE